MAIGTNALIDFFGTQDEVTVASPASVANGAYSVQADINTWTNDDDAKVGYFVLKFDPSAAPTKGDVIELHARRLNVLSADDEPQPDSNFDGPARIGLLYADVDAAAHLAAGVCVLPNTKTSQEYEFYIKNTMTTVSIDTTTWELHVTPLAPGPHA